MKAERRWIERIIESLPVLVLVGGMVVGGIAWFIRIESKVTYLFDRSEKLSATSDQKTKERNQSDEDQRTRLTRLEQCLMDHGWKIER